MLGKLEKVELREIWETEGQGFAPWLVEEGNSELLELSQSLKFRKEMRGWFYQIISIN